MTSYGIIGLGRLGCPLARRLTDMGHTVLGADIGADKGTSTVEDIADCDVIVECVVEDFETKVDVLRPLVGGDAPVLTTTSSFTVADLAAASGLGGRLVGFHHLASADGRLVELVRADSTPAAQSAAAQLAAELDLDVLDVPDRPGRIARRLLVPFVQNALRAVDLGIASPADLDLVVRLGLGHAVGPLARLEVAGPDDHRAVAALLASHGSIAG